MASTRISSAVRRALVDLIGAERIGSARGSLDFGSISAGLQARLTLTVTGAALGDEVTAASETDIEAGLAYTAVVSAADTVAVIMINNTAGAIDPAANVFKVRVARRTV